MDEPLLFDLMAAPDESTGDINNELLRRAQALPQYADKVFIMGEGRAGVKLVTVGESPGV